jgi:cryptochrome
MFDFDQRRQVCLDSMKNAYDVGLHGADKEVMNGSWRERFDMDEKPPKRQKTEK